MCSVLSVILDRFAGIWNQESRASAYGIAGLKLSKGLFKLKRLSWKLSSV